MGFAIDIEIDWNEEDDTGFPWTLVSRSPFPDRIVPGRFVVAGRGTAVAVAEVVDRDDDGVVHLRAVPGSLADNSHLLVAGHPA